MKKSLLIILFSSLFITIAQAEIKDFMYDGKEIYLHVKKDHVSVVIFPEPIISVIRGFGADTFILQRNNKEPNKLEVMPTNTELAEFTVSGVSGEDFVLRCVANDDPYTKLVIHRLGTSYQKSEDKMISAKLDILPEILSEKQALKTQSLTPVTNKKINSPYKDNTEQSSDLPSELNLRITLKGNDLPLKIYLSTISQVTHYNIITTPEIDSQKTSINLENIDDISAIQDASRAYYIANSSWPLNVSTLQNNGYLPSAWNPINPFGYSAVNQALYSYNLSLSGTNPGSSLIVSTFIPNTDAQPIIRNLLAASSVDLNNNVSSSVSVPGAINILPTGSILPWTGTDPAILGAGYILCNGQAISRTQYQALFDLIGTAYGVGDGSTTFNVPNLQGRTVFGYLAGDSNFGTLGNTGGHTTMIGDGGPTGPVDSFNSFNRVKISGGNLWGITGGQQAQGVSTVVLNPYITLNYIIKT